MIEALNEHRAKITDDLKRYIAARVRMHKLVVLEEGTRLISDFYSSLSLGVIFVLVVLFVSIGGAIYLGDRLDNEAVGFIVFAGVILVLGVLVYYIVRKRTEKYVLTHLQEILFEKEENPDDEES
jgi:hypothetical protein